VNLDVPRIGPAVVTLGVFDGVHLGHRHLVAETRRAARERDAASVAIVFDPPPVEVVRPGTSVPRLLPLDLVEGRLGEAGIDHAIVVSFDDAVRQMPPASFLEALEPAIELRGVAMTPGSAFGHERAGTLDHVTGLGRVHGFDAIAVDPLLVDGAPVSSTRVREAIATGNIREAARLLTRPPLLRGTVVHGDGRGRELGFPTANLAFDYAPVLPALGIYLGHVRVAERGVGPHAQALVSVGVRPTFHEAARVLVEAYLLDFEGDLYDAALTLEVGDRLRGERRFDSVGALVKQMKRDEAEARGHFASMAGGQALW
jgi:riboflavin kinase / FMN adenylyltransferase